MGGLFFIVWLFSIFIAAAVTFYYKKKIITRLEMNHYEIYKGLLLSKGFDDNEIEKQALFDKFVKHKNYLSLEDEVLIFYCRKYVFYGRIFVTLFILLVTFIGLCFVLFKIYTRFIEFIGLF